MLWGWRAAVPEGGGVESSLRPRFTAHYSNARPTGGNRRGIGAGFFPPLGRRISPPPPPNGFPPRVKHTPPFPLRSRDRAALQRCTWRWLRFDSAPREGGLSENALCVEAQAPVYIQKWADSATTQQPGQEGCGTTPSRNTTRGGGLTGRGPQ